ncbi:MAG: hypothetical protein SGPRY_006004 [Prymnesium sp.]
MLGWQAMVATAGQPVLTRLEIFKALGAFMGKFSLSPRPELLPVLNTVSFLECDHSDCAWSRIIDGFMALDIIGALEEADARMFEASLPMIVAPSGIATCKERVRQPGPCVNTF